jgi:hypothetical protein
MTQKATPPAVPLPDKDHLEELARGARATMVASLRLMREELDRMTVERGDYPEFHRQYAALRDALQKMIEQENRLNDYLAKLHGPAAAPEFDLDAIRHEIGCKLARLRACCEVREVPGGVEPG